MQNSKLPDSFAGDRQDNFFPWLFCCGKVPDMSLCLTDNTSELFSWRILHCRSRIFRIVTSHLQRNCLQHLF